MTIKAVLLDLDDTLWPVAPVIQHAEATLYTWMQQHVPNVTAQHDIVSLRSLRQALVTTDPRFSYDLWALRHQLLQNVFRQYDEDVGKADQAMAVFAHARNQVSLYPDVAPALGVLGQRVKLGTISNGFADLQAIGLAGHFHVSVAAHQFGCAKPDARIFHAACDGLGLAPYEVLYVGDDLLLDVQGAQQAGLKAGWMNRRSLVNDDPRHSHVKPDAEFKDLHDLTQWL
ncbi:HAD family hydrolase [Undibacterium jejuense]|uniref:HAD family hydrolase n=1 Tax=Undibacterium jejuense TaxID=1344949 RepID=A0A923KNS1_9BURK|nr:HAD family hydrolase [Undibacterium jejuense]MBC3861434.1 HAD family hydrolase [Undibacterium jejuense]